MSDTPDLYRVTSTYESEFVTAGGTLILHEGEDEVRVSRDKDGYLVKNLEITWFMRVDGFEMRFDTGVYNAAIESFADSTGKQRDFGVDAVNELFTRQEAEHVQTYLELVKDRDEVTHAIKPADLPYPQNIMGLGATPVGGPNDFVMLHWRNDYSLPFDVRGYYDIRNHETIHASKLN